MPLKLTDDLFANLEPPETIDWTLVGLHYPLGNPEPIVLELKWAGHGSDFAKEQKKLALKPLQDETDDLARDLRIFARTAIGGWRNVGDNEPFSAKDAGELLVRTMRARKAQGLVEARMMIAHVQRPSTFWRPDPVDAGDLGKE
jgi:hypothetical protein